MPIYSIHMPIGNRYPNNSIYIIYCFTHLHIYIFIYRIHIEYTYRCKHIQIHQYPILYKAKVYSFKYLISKINIYGYKYLYNYYHYNLI